MRARLSRSFQPPKVDPIRQPHEIDQLFQEHAVTVSRWAARLGGPSIDVEDVVQEVFMVAHRRLAEFRGEAKVSTWLFRITQNVASHHRRRARWRRWLRGSATDVGGRLPAPQLDPVEEMVRKQAAAQIYAVLDRMSEKFRTVLILANFDGLDANEIAAATGVQPATARVWLHRARLQYQRLAAARGEVRP